MDRIYQLKYLCSVVLHLRDAYVFVCFVLLLFVSSYFSSFFFLLVSSCCIPFLSVSTRFGLFLPIIFVPFSFFLVLLCYSLFFLFPDFF